MFAPRASAARTFTTTEPASGSAGIHPPLDTSSAVASPHLERASKVSRSVTSSQLTPAFTVANVKHADQAAPISANISVSSARYATEDLRSRPNYPLVWFSSTSRHLILQWRPWPNLWPSPFMRYDGSIRPKAKRLFSSVAGQSAVSAVCCFHISTMGSCCLRI